MPNLGPFELVLLAAIIGLLFVGRTPQPEAAEQAGEASPTTPAVIRAGWLFAFLMPLIGFVLGLTQINRSPAALRIIVVSVCMALVWLAVISAGAQS